MASARLDLDIKEWWAHIAEDDADLFVSKSGEYGSVDLEIMGAAMELQGVAPKGGGQLAAIMFYALGKVARAISALDQGRWPSEDTLKDLTIYAMMARIQMEKANEK